MASPQQIVYCPKCGNELYYDHVVWNDYDDEYYFNDWLVHCPHCGDGIVKETYILKDIEMEWKKDGLL